ncbi:hypothetical protein [Streptomyces sviceus]|uniref:hypothetical protein n=1 Tax=Streptomyces sviceus TaxID=285530 RepID=UPI0036ECF687
MDGGQGDRRRPGRTAANRDFRTDLDTSARQLTIEVGTKTRAAALATRMNKEIRTLRPVPRG